MGGDVCGIEQTLHVSDVDDSDEADEVVLTQTYVKVSQQSALRSDSTRGKSGVQKKMTVAKATLDWADDEDDCPDGGCSSSLSLIQTSASLQRRGDTVSVAVRHDGEPEVYRRFAMPRGKVQAAV